MAAQGKVILISRGRILSELSPYARSAFLPLLHQRGIELHEATGGVARVDAAQLTLQDGTLVPCDACLWCTQAGAASWLASSGLPTDAAGFLAVNGFLQSDGGPPNVFGAGDTVSMTQHPRPKAGVYAVRAVRLKGPHAPNLLQQHAPAGADHLLSCATHVGSVAHFCDLLPDCVPTLTSVGCPSG